MPSPTSPQRRFAFISSNATPWGGSEELWSAAAASLAELGHEVAVFKTRIDERQPRIQRLRALGCRLHDLLRLPMLPRLACEAIARMAYPLITLNQIVRVRLGLMMRRPDLVIVSQGHNLDGGLLIDICRRLKLPYIVIVQKAADLYWPTNPTFARLRAGYESSLACLFVSEHNRRLTEEQLGLDLAQAKVVRNPFLVSWDAPLDWPDERDGLKIACVGRLYTAEKGQDLLLRVLSRDRWRERPVTVTIFGDGPHRFALENGAAHRGLKNVKFAGFVSDPAAIWKTHHALIVPSRAEGLPLVLVEAMISRRVAIATDVAGHSEVVRDGVTGFLASSATEDALDAALDRAWQRRAEWRAIGAAAGEEIRKLVPPDPPAVLARLLEDYARGVREAGAEENSPRVPER